MGFSLQGRATLSCFICLQQLMEKSNKLEKTGSLEKWRCSVCEFDNLALIKSCEMCDTPRLKSARQIEEERKKQNEAATVQCPNKDCKQANALTNQYCEHCEMPLYPSQSQDEGEKQKKKVDAKEMVQCKKCLFLNDVDNSICANCDKKLIPRRIPGKSIKPKKARKSRARYGTSPCPTCGEDLAITDYTTKETDICMACQMKKPFEIKKKHCLFCDKKLSFSQEKTHDQGCKQRKIFYARAQNPTYDRCTDLQYETMIYMHNKCERLHYRKEAELVKRIKILGYSEKDLENLHHYIMHYAPIIIHMHVNTHFHFFLKDTHYRNQFQTSMSSGSLSHAARTGWENRMFDKKHQHASGFERVKYGTMNFTNDPSGVRVCLGYGQSYFLLKLHVRDRCTITDMDSSSPSATLGTFRFIFHLLMKLSDAELKSAFEGSKGKEMLSSVIGAYKEIQIHGPVEFAKDIERVYVSKAELKLGDAKALLEQVKTFCSKNKIQYELFDSVAAAAPFGAIGATDLVAPERIVGDKKQLTEEDLKPPPPPPAPVFGGFGAGFGAAGLGFGSYAFPASSFSFGVPSATVSYFAPPKPPEKKKQYGVDYI